MRRFRLPERWKNALRLLGTGWLVWVAVGKFSESVWSGLKFVTGPTFLLVFIWYVDWNPWREPEDGDEETPAREGS